jgi:DNA-binding MltR family transcriptional regulator
MLVLPFFRPLFLMKSFNKFCSQKCIRCQIPWLSAFSLGYGPLESFSGKIEVSYAFELIDEETYYDLRIIKEIRNTFAHAAAVTHFRSDEVTKFLKKFKQWNAVIDPLLLFNERVAFCLTKIDAALERLILASALSEPGASPP